MTAVPTAVPTQGLPTPGGSPAPVGSPGPLDILGPEVRRVLTAALAAEQAAVYGYGALGPALPRGRRAAARSAQAAHLARRDRLEATLRSAGTTPPAPPAAYDVPAVTAAAAAAALAAAMEDRVCAAHADVVAAAEGAERSAAAAAVTDAAVRAALWRGAPTAFPGLPERA